MAKVWEEAGTLLEEASDAVVQGDGNGGCRRGVSDREASQCSCRREKEMVQGKSWVQRRWSREKKLEQRDGAGMTTWLWTANRPRRWAVDGESLMWSREMERGARMQMPLPTANRKRKWIIDGDSRAPMGFRRRIASAGGFRQRIPESEKEMEDEGRRRMMSCQPWDIDGELSTATGER